jgi:hypothetical protein
MLLTSKNIETAYKNALKMKELVDTIFSCRAYLDAIYDPDIYKADGSMLHKKLSRQFSGFFSRLFSGEYRRIISDLQLSKKDGKKPKYKVAMEHLNKLAVYQQSLTEYDAIATKTIAMFGEGYNGINTDFKALLEELKALVDVDQSGAIYGNIANLQTSDFVEKQADFVNIYNELNKAFVNSGKAEDRLHSQFSYDFKFKECAVHDLAAKCSSYWHSPRG